MRKSGQKKIKVLLTGATGFLGSNILKEINRNKNIEITTLTRKKIKIKNIKTNNLDLYNLKKIKIFLKKEKFDRIIHAAWCNNFKNMMNSELNLNWIIITKNLIKYFFLYGGEYFLCIGSVDEYKNKKTKIYRETDELQFGNFYSKAKISILKYLKKNYKKKFLWCRVFWLYGKNENKRRLIPIIKEAIYKKKVTNIHNYNHELDYLNVNDAAKIIVKLFVRKKKGVFNICSGNAISIFNICKMIGKNLKYFNFIENNSYLYVKGCIKKLKKNNIIKKEIKISKF